MLKDIDKYSSTHFSYKEYRKKVNKEPNKDLILFVSVFIIGVLLSLGFARVLSPNVDVTVGNNDFFKEDVNENTSSVIDERLKRIQMEDSGASVEDKEMFSPELDQKIHLPKKSAPNAKEEVNPKDNSLITRPEKHEKDMRHEKDFKHEKDMRYEKEANAVQKPEPAPERKHIRSEQITTAKVVVGFYATEKQAEVAKSIMQDAGIGVTPIVKNMGEYYSIQVGSYSSKDRAQNAANDLIKNNFPARVVVE